ncbi:MAG: carboxypeptidase-like regulatory domain-containing protein [Bacteroidetes bacterium]|nr:carboxypeptidase-like regulatory domain-containing protein [Bacteroidota bacterium]
MSFRRIILLLVFLPFLSRAQTVISGKVTTSGSLTPIGKVSVFLSNSSYGTETSEDGTFHLVGVKPGQYELVASSVGYQEYTESILVSSSPVTVNIKMLPKMNMLRGVVISSNADWKKNYELFRKDFIGESDNGKKCDVVNPRTMNLVYHGKSRTLEAWSTDFLVVDNRALGYRVKFLVDTFSSSGLSGIVEWQGKVVFEEMKGSEEQKKEWREKREQIYYGSQRQFFRSLYNNTLTQDGFIMYHLSREPNADRPPEAVILAKMKYFREIRFNRDSFNYWVGKENLSKYYHEHLDKTPLQPYQVFAQTSKPGLFVLSFRDCLYVIYTKRREETDFKDVYRTLDMENFETSILTLMKPYAIFDMNGVVVQNVPLAEGSWSKDKLGELLPLDYVPGEDK